MAELPVVSAEPTAEESTPETTTEETYEVEPTPEVYGEEPESLEDKEPEPEETPEEETTEPSGDDIASEESEDEEPKGRAGNRIRDLIDQKKQLEAETAYWKAQALQSQQPAPQRGQNVDFSDLEGITEEGIDPQAFANSLWQKFEQRLNQTQAQVQTQSVREAEELEVSARPEMQDEVFANYVVGLAKARGYSPREAYLIAKDDFTKLTTKNTATNQVRKEAGTKTRKATATPSSGRGTSDVSGTFTREQIASMKPETYEKHREDIEKQLAAGLIQ